MNIVPILLLGGSLVSMIVIVARRFPQLSLLDVDNIPGMKEEKKKTEFLKKRVEQKATEQKEASKERWRPVIRSWKEAQLAFRKYVGQLERRIMRERASIRKEAMSPSKESLPPSEDVRTLLNDATFACQHDELETAEKKYIAAIRMDPKQKDAYLGLGDVYRKQGQVEEAEESYIFVTQLDPSDDRPLVKLAELAEEKGQTEQAIQYYEQAVLKNDNMSPRFAKLAELFASIGQYKTAMEAVEQAVELEPLNPKYLDMMVEISILGGNKETAQRAHDALRMANPENQKLAAFRDRIDKMN